jgi:hypothetical protein
MPHSPIQTLECGGKAAAFPDSFVFQVEGENCTRAAALPNNTATSRVTPKVVSFILKFLADELNEGFYLLC